MKTIMALLVALVLPGVASACPQAVVQYQAAVVAPVVQYQYAVPVVQQVQVVQKQVAPVVVYPQVQQQVVQKVVQPVVVERRPLFFRRPVTRSLSIQRTVVR